MTLVQTIAEELASSRFRFLTDIQIGAMRRKYGASRDEVRSAAIVANRLRRQRQLQEGRLGFTISPQIAPDAPIHLPKEKLPKWQKAHQRRSMG